MSAIFGIISKQGKAIEPEFAETMKKELKHRAVDGRCYYQTETVFIGHHKFISNVHQKNEQQPIEDELYVITADARIDNRDELINLLEIGRDDISDAYIILQSFYKWNKNCTQYMEGEFAFVIYHKQNNTIFAATDHMGNRSFYYYNHPDYFIFSSELKGISILNFVPKEYNETILVEFFSAQFSNITQYKNIFILLSGFYLVLEQNKPLKTVKYWMLASAGRYKFKRDSDWAECLKELMFTSVRKRINTELPVGIKLSGGLDSSFIAGIASAILKEKNKQLIAISSVLPPDYKGIYTDESYYIKSLVSFAGNIDYHPVSLPVGTGLFTDAEKMLYQTGYFGLTLPQIMVQRFNYVAKDIGINVLLNGIGGDSTISYSGRTAIWEMFKKGEFLKAITFMQKKIKHGDNFLSIIKNDILKNVQLVKSSQANPLLSFLYSDLKQKVRNNSYPHFNFYNDFITYRVNNTDGYRLHYYKCLSAHFNYEPASPVCDKSILEFFVDIPEDQFIYNGQKRSLIRKAMKGLVPDIICERMDKSPLIPDWPERYSIDIDNVFKLFINNKIAFENAGINTDKLASLIKKEMHLPLHPNEKQRCVNIMLVLSIFFCFKTFFGNLKE